MLFITCLMVFLIDNDVSKDHDNADISNGSHEMLLAFSISSLHLHRAYCGQRI